MISIGITSLALTLLVAQAPSGGTPDSATGEPKVDTAAEYLPAEVTPSPTVELEGPATLPPPTEALPAEAKEAEKAKDDEKKDEKKDDKAEPATAEEPEAKALPKPTRPRLLVMPLVDKGAGAEITAAVNEAVANQAIKSHAGEVVTSEQIRVVLEAQAAQQMLGCDSDGCLSQLGSAVDASLVLGGNVAKVGDDILITVMAVETTTGMRKGEAQRKVPLHRDLYYYAARQLASLTLTGHSVDPTVPVMIAASEAGAGVLVDGRDVGEAPLTLPLDPGNHEVVVKLDGFATWKTTVLVEDATPLSVTANLVSTGFPLWPVALGFGAISLASGMGATAVALYAYDFHSGVIGIIPDAKANSYAHFSPATSYDLALKEQQFKYLQIAEVSLWVISGGFAVLGIGVESAEILRDTLFE